jgi:hypothetical protein
MFFWLAYVVQDSLLYNKVLSTQAWYTCLLSACRYFNHGYLDLTAALTILLDIAACSDIELDTVDISYVTVSMSSRYLLR